MSDNPNYGKSVEDYLTSLFFIRKVKTYFKMMDVNNDGYLTMADYDLIADRLIKNQGNGQDADKIRAIWRNVFKGIMAGNKECDEKTKVSYEELLINMATVCYHREETLKNVHTFSEMIFDYIDLDKNGVISMDEYKKYQSIYFGREVDDASEFAFRTIDRDDDGFITRQEFYDAKVAHGFEAFGDEYTSPLPFGPLVQL